MGSSLPSRGRSRRGEKTTHLRGKIALVTGANQGIGFAIARALAAEGCRLIISGRNQEKLNRAERELKRYKVRVLPVVCDVREPKQVRSLFSTARREFARLDILINNAGVAHPSLEVAELPFEVWRDVIETNLNGMFLVTQAALPLMKRGGTIVNNLSIAAKRVFAGQSAYNASKHGAFGFTNTLREELRPQGIRVIALLPGATDTPIWNTVWPEAPRKKMLAADTVASTVVNLLVLREDSTMEELVLMPSAGVL
jgi:NAD(P)-dependent dehydrogenase (short-subunit alcohol dehydrogenase family)